MAMGNNVDPGEPAWGVCVIIATRGRAEVLANTLLALRAQTLPPKLTVVSCVIEGDVRGVPLGRDLLIVKSKPGLAAQRNAGLKCVPYETEIVIFFDDDFLPHVSWISEAVAAFRAHRGIVSITGSLIADGIKGPGIPVEEGRTLLLRSVTRPKQLQIISPYIPYGCNMAFRTVCRNVGTLRS